MKAILLAGALALGLAAAATAQPPTSMNHRDPEAPCFRWPAVDMDQDGVFDRIDRCVSTPRGCAVDRWGCSSDADEDGVCDGLDRCPNTPHGMDVDAEGCAESQRGSGARPQAPPQSQPVQPAPPPRTEAERQLVERGRIRLENVYFETGSARILSESESSLDEAGRALEKYPSLRIEIEGHTDTRGSDRFNRRLSQERAEAVREYLLANYTLRPEHIVARGYGETQPETRERNEEELLRNRRVVLRVLNPDVLPRGVEVEKR